MAGFYTSHTFDAGVDIDAANGLIGVTFDYFVRNRTGFVYPKYGNFNVTASSTLGIGLPQQNLNSDRTNGFDLEVSHRNHIAVNLST